MSFSVRPTSRIIGDIVTSALDTLKNTYSVFISEEPYRSTGDMNFLYLCSDASITYSVSYSGTTTGILGQSPSNAIFVDPSTGAVGNINVSGTRVNPSTSANAPSDYPSNLVSNATFYAKIKEMLTKNQMFQNAYVLRIYNSDWKDSTSHATYRELYVHISKFDMTINWTNTNEAEINLSCFRRNLTKGFGDV